jgi:integrase
MGMGSIQIRGKKNRIRAAFFYKGVRRFENTNYYCETGKNDCKCRPCRSAIALLGEIERKIGEGTFKYSEYFPDSKVLKDFRLAEASPNVGFSTYAWQWLDLKEPSLAFSTHKGYLSIIRKLSEYFGQTELAQIRYSHIQAYIKADGTKPKTISNTMNLLNQIFISAIHDEIVSKNPVEFISKPKIQSVQIDPFDKTEAAAIIDWIEKNHPRLACFFALGFYTGMRTGELLALKWSDVDFNSHTIKVQRTITKARVKESTKTAESRTIDIIPALDKYLKRQKQFTFLKSEWVTTTSFNKPFMKTENMKVYYNPCLKALGLRFRNLYQMRHSFACMMIDAGEELNWIKNMLGHKTLEMIFKRYGNRINRNDGKRKGVIFSDNVSSK